MSDFVSMGELLVEFVANEDNVSLANTASFVKAPGGAPANVAVAVQKLGLSAGFVGKVGDDPFGDYLRQSLDETGVDTRYLLVDRIARTTAVFVAVWDDGRKDLCFYRNPGADMLLTEDDITTHMFEGGRCFHFGSITFIDEPSAAAQHKALRIARERKMMITYDPNYRPTLWPNVQIARSVIQSSFQYCHLAKISEEEWEVATGHPELDAGIEWVLSQGVELVVVSRGERGALVTNGEYRIDLPAYEVEVVETTGAGDGFMAAMIVRLLSEREKHGSLARIDEATMRAAIDFANAVGALVCTRRGAIPALPTLAQVERFMQTNRS